MRTWIFTLFLGISLVACGQSGPAKGPDSKRNIAANVSASELNDILKKQGIQVLDIRTAGEMESGMIPGAVPLDFYDAEFAQKAERFDKNRPVLLYCAAGGRSAKALEMFEKAGFKEVYNLLGGYPSYKKTNP